MSSLSAYQLLALSTSLAGSMAPQRLSSSIFPPPPQLGVCTTEHGLPGRDSQPPPSGQGREARASWARSTRARDIQIEKGAHRGGLLLHAPPRRWAKPTSRSAVLLWIRLSRARR